MTNDERNSNDEVLNELQSVRWSWTSGFNRQSAYRFLSSFVIRHSSFVIRHSAAWLLSLILLACPWPSFAVGDDSPAADDDEIERARNEQAAGSGFAALQMESAMILKTFTNVDASAEVSPPAPAQTKRVSSELALAAFLGLVAFRVLIPRVARGAPVEADTASVSAGLVAEEKSFAKFADEFAIGPKGARSGLASAGPARCILKGNGQRRSEEMPPQEPEMPRTAAEDINALRTLFSGMGKITDEAERRALLAQLDQGTQALKNKLDSPDQLSCWQLVCALEGLLNQLLSKPSNVTPSALRTVANALDLLHTLCQAERKPDLKQPAVRVLAVDDNAVCRYLISFALQKVLSTPDVAADGRAALALGSELAYDLIFLDIEMPGMDGFELLSRLRATPHNQATPVVFITQHNDLHTRAQAILTGAGDFISKPFLTFEVTVKAFTLILQRRLRDGGVPAAAPAANPPTQTSPPASAIGTLPPALEGTSSGGSRVPHEAHEPAAA